jgi:hypothetical protein
MHCLKAKSVMKIVQILVCSVTAFMYIPTTHCDEVITLFMKPYPLLPNNDYGHQVSRKLKEPGAIAHHTLHGILQKHLVSGIFSTYHGYLGISDYNGQTTYPRKLLEPVLYLLVTTRITPSVVTANTLDHWELETDTPAQMYKFERKKDEYVGLSYWDVKEMPLPEDSIIPRETIIIFARPQDIYVAEGVSEASDRPNLVLPDIYVKKGIKIYSSTLYVLNIRQFFGAVKLMKQIRDMGYSELVDPHPTWR